MIRVIAVLTVNAGRREELIEQFRANRPAVLAEQGCLEYMGVVDFEGSRAKYGLDVFVVIETWESPEALAAHAAAPHMAAFGEKTRDLIADRKIHVLAPV